MARRRAKMPTVAEMMPRPRVRGGAGSVYDAQVLGRAAPSVARATDFASSRTAKDEASRNQSPETAAAIQAAEMGDDSLLLPYQPTPSINPPRPRTMAAGYDAQTQTLRVKFREGAVYEYHNVPPRVWRNFKRVKSPGRAINRTLNQYAYNPMDLSE